MKIFQVAFIVKSTTVSLKSYHPHLTIMAREYDFDNGNFAEQVHKGKQLSFIITYIKVNDSDLYDYDSDLYDYDSDLYD